MKEIAYVQITEEAKRAIQFDFNEMNSGTNKHRKTRKPTSFGITLRYLFAVKDLSFQQVGDILGITRQAVNHIVNRMAEENFDKIVFAEKMCKKLNIDYAYFCNLCDKVKELM